MPKTTDKSTTTTSVPPKSQTNTITLALGVTVVILLLVSGWSFYNYQKAKQEIKRLSSVEGQQQVADKEVQALLDKIKAHMVLPEDEKPTVATISDIDTLVSTQPFFQGAANGDKVLVYSKANKAIIYSPDRDVVVNVGNIQVDTGLVNSSQVQEEVPTIEEE